MADVIILNDENKEKVGGILTKAIQSGYINFLLGSGASMPAIQVAGDIESEAHEMFINNDEAGANKKLAELLNAVNAPTNKLIENHCADMQTAILNYEKFTASLEHMLVKRRSNILPRQINIFTTNYDLFVEAAIEKRQALILNDGFDRQASISNSSKFYSGRFFDSIFHRGPVHGYTTEVPCINLIKIHGSLSWKKEGDEIFYHIGCRELLTEEHLNEKDKVEEYLEGHCLILPHKGKFRETVKERVYYDLMRLYSNELDRENALLLAFGFSFNDEHIFDVTQRALKNPALLVMVFAYDSTAKESLLSKFAAYHNVIIVSPDEDNKIGFTEFSDLLSSALPEGDHASS